ncbi:MAG: hypothetical protein PHD12_01750 [Methylotenera sp.]|nr:hypothetical protein [Methylotenera sp.]
MSKINPVQANALKAPAEKPAAIKPTATQTAVKKAVTGKSTAVKASPANKPVNTPAAAAVAKPAEKPVEKNKSTTKAVKEKTPKLKMERDSFTMPKTEYAQFGVLKSRLEKLGQPAKKSELIRAGLMLLAAMTDTTLKTTLSKVPTIKTGRPKKK